MQCVSNKGHYTVKKRKVMSFSHLACNVSQGTMGLGGGTFGHILHKKYIEKCYRSMHRKQ